jgi:DNA invertase Pin-like site-specific DNA recombinase
MPRYKHPQQPIDPYKSQPLPLGRPVAVYYRQSSEGQIGNISTTLQTVDMVEHLQRQGWQRHQILMIDMDAGISGTKKIVERPGMSYLYTLIENGEIGLCAAQDVDRFFRDLTQIETNIFIDACKRSNVQVLTPTFVYDFAHPMQGRYHMQMFREQAQRAADYLEFHINGRLLKSRQFMMQGGQWAGSKTLLGYMVDKRTHLPTGERNPDRHRYVRCEPQADMVVKWFELFKQYQGNLKRTWEHIEQHGPFIPEFNQITLPNGFALNTNIRKRSRFTGGLMLSMASLGELLRNAAYIGHWAHQGVIVRKHNHEAIVPLDVFLYAFNKLSPVDFNGDPNPDYQPYRSLTRHDKSDRPIEPPTYTGVVFSPDIPDEPLRRMTTNYDAEGPAYYYYLTDGYKRTYMTLASEPVDCAVDRMLLERLEATTLDEEVWQRALASTHQSSHVDVRRIENAIQAAQRAQGGIVENLKVVALPELVRQLEASYAAHEQDIARLRRELADLQQDNRHQRVLLEARPVLETVIARWNDVPRASRRELFDAFAQRIVVSKIDMIHRRVTVCWRDNSESSDVVKPQRRNFAWSPDELDRLRQMVENSTDQVELLKAFDGVTWRNLQERYAYHFGAGRWFAGYTGQRKYGKHTRWQDTEEFKREQQAQIPATGACA